MRVLTSKQHAPLGGFVRGTMIDEATYFGLCRNRAIGEALECINEAIRSDRRTDTHVDRHLQVARDAVLDALSVAAETQS